MKKPILLILAAGIGSRYGGIKQIDQFGPNGETIIDYSLYDAIRAGFGKVVFIIRKELKSDFEEIFAPKLKGKIDYEYAFQEYESYVPKEFGTVNRAKPWGTGHAMLCAWEYTKAPFAVINADDFYGTEAFKTMAEFLSANTDENLHAMVGYQIKNTLSENGTVSRGVCEKDKNGLLTSVVERTKIIRNEEGQIQFLDEAKPVNLDENTPVSMNFWGFMPNVFSHTKRYFEQYAKDNFDLPKAEFYIPTIMSKMMDENVGECRVFNTTSDWFGVTYPEDKEKVQASIKKLLDARKYPQMLWD